MTNLFISILLFQSIALSQNLNSVKKCHDAILNDIIGWGFVTADFSFVPSIKNKSQFMLSNGKDKHYICSTAPDPLKDRTQIFINQNLEGFTKTFIAVKNENRKSWNLIPTQQIDPKISNIVADCKKVADADKALIDTYTEYTKSLIEELKLDYDLKVAETINNYDLVRLKPTAAGDAKQVASKEANLTFYKTLDVCRDSQELTEISIKTEQKINFVMIDRKNSRTRIPTRDRLSPTKVESATPVTLPPSQKR